MPSAVPSTPQLYRLFVYGSLKKGEYNHPRFGMDHALLLGTTALPGFRLFHNGAYPAAVPDEQSRYFLMGEIYEVGADLAATIARVEKGAGYKDIIVESPLGPVVIWVKETAPVGWTRVGPFGRDSLVLNWDSSKLED